MLYILNHNGLTCDVEKNPPISNAQSIGGLEVRQPLHITRQIVPHPLDLGDHPPCNVRRHRLECSTSLIGEDQIVHHSGRFRPALNPHPKPPRQIFRPGRVDEVRDDIGKYFESDLLCYRAGHPQELVSREAQAWDGVLFWAAETFGARFILAEGIIHATQSQQALSAARNALPREPWSVAAVHIVTTITGSAVLALALYHGARDADQVWTAAHVDDDWNIEHWGVDEEVAARRAAKDIDFRAAAAVIAAMKKLSDQSS